MTVTAPFKYKDTHSFLANTHGSRLALGVKGVVGASSGINFPRSQVCAVTFSAQQYHLRRMHSYASQAHYEQNLRFTIHAVSLFSQDILFIIAAKYHNHRRPLTTSFLFLQASAIVFTGV